MSTKDIESNAYKKQFLHEATKLAIESVEKGRDALYPEPEHICS